MEENIKEKKGFKKWWFGTNEVFRGIICGLVGLILFTSIALPVGLSVSSKNDNNGQSNFVVDYFKPEWDDEEEQNYLELFVFGSNKVEKDKKYTIEIDLSQCTDKPTQLLSDSSWSISAGDGSSLSTSSIGNILKFVEINDIKVNNTSLNYLGKKDFGEEEIGIKSGEYCILYDIDEGVESSLLFFNFNDLINDSNAKIRIDFIAKETQLFNLMLMNVSSF